MIAVVVERSFESFRAQCRKLIDTQVPPEEVTWSDSAAVQPSLFAPEALSRQTSSTKLKVPRRYFELARIVSHHREVKKWSLLYSVLWRLLHDEPHLLSVHIDSEVLQLDLMRDQIARDVHHVHAFVRFRRVEREGNEWFVGWYRPDHPDLRLAAPFFAERFAEMRWAILTPDESAIWDKEQLRFGPGVERPDDGPGDDLEQIWSTYYRTTFNPARMNLNLMRQEMPARFWSTLPELRDLSGMLAEAPTRLATMQRQQSTSAAAVVPNSTDMSELRAAASRCTACPLHCEATQTVFGDGPSTARIVLVGEQPGDQEDLIGRPFVGPAGEVLRRAMEAAGVERTDVYVTNAVKHFKFVREGKRRIHQTPRMPEVIACKPWLEAELKAIQPSTILLMGSTATKSLLGSTVSVTRDAGKIFETHHAKHIIFTVHPSFVLRSREPQQAEAAFQRLVTDLKSVLQLGGSRSAA